MIYLDTHVVVWLYSGDLSLFPGVACQRLEEHELVISPMVLLELQYLYEIGKIVVEPLIIFDSLAESIGLWKCRASFGRVIAESMRITWTRDPCDRIITATALLHDTILITKDEAIRSHCDLALWEE